ncbi:MAG: Holliday junction branch migration protein RuvA [Eggerthellaceae bacterium]|nr:Holliday junction branch migration protein RuvA [Eggerthellaceae bacterium]
MIAFLSGTLAVVTSQAAYIDVGGVGYQVLMSQRALSKLPHQGAGVRVLTYLQASESGLALYGFLREEEKALFERLIAVSGVGPKAALATLSTFTPGEFAAAVASQDVKAVQKIPGVGKKTASRIILELKGSFDVQDATLFSASSVDGEPIAQHAEGTKSASTASAFKDIAQALLGMGFSPAEVDLALESAPQDASEAAVLQYALRRLGGR